MQALQRQRLLMFQDNDPAMVRDLAMDGALAAKAAFQLDWSGTWLLETGMPSCELERADPAPLKVIIRFELPAPIWVGKLLTTGFGLSRSAVKGMVDSGRIRLPMAIDAKAREDFTLFVITTPPPPRGAAADQKVKAGNGFHPAATHRHRPLRGKARWCGGRTLCRASAPAGAGEASRERSGTGCGAAPAPRVCGEGSW